MSFTISASTVSSLRSRYMGRRVRLIHTSDPYTSLTAGSEGTVDWVDDVGTVFVKWDSGSSLGLVRGEDTFEVIT